MAKGNLFLGMGRGSVGDVTFYRADGQQLSRARNRKPRNPKTNAQLIQRAISATIVQAYKAGSVIFDHSFEGKSVPAGSQRAFLSTNMRKLREQILAQIELTPSESTASVVSPRAVYPVPNAYRISEGSLIQNLFMVTVDDNDHPLVRVVEPATMDETVAAAFSRLGIQAGDIFTIVCFGSVDTNGRANSLVSRQCTFGFMRLTVKQAAISLATTVQNATFQEIFDIDSSGANLPSGRKAVDGVSISDIDIAGSNNGCIGVIRSNENSGLRSTCDMTLPSDLEEPVPWSVAPSNLLAAWSQDSGQVDSELILEGGDI